IAAKVSQSRSFMTLYMPSGTARPFLPDAVMPKRRSGRKAKKQSPAAIQRENAMRTIFALLVGLSSVAAAPGAGAETLKVAVAQRGFWNSTFIDVGLKQGYFKEAGLDIEILYTEGGASTLTPVIAGSIDIAMTNGILGVVAAYAKGMPVRIISAEATGAADAFWYARPESGIKGLADTNGKTVAFSSPGSSTNLILLQLINQAKATPKLVATGGAPGTLTQVMSGQIDVGWSVPPFVLQQLADGKLGIIAKGSDVAAHARRILSEGLAAAGRSERPRHDAQAGAGIQVHHHADERRRCARHVRHPASAEVARRMYSVASILAALMALAAPANAAEWPVKPVRLIV